MKNIEIRKKLTQGIILKARHFYHFNFNTGLISSYSYLIIYNA